jgi:flagellar motility protein MotE (MotC chaperone)
MKIRQVTPRKTGTMTVIIGLFLASGLIRAVDIAPAIAQEIAAPKPDSAEPVQTASATPAPDMPAMLKALQDREAQISAREAYIDRRMHTLAVAEQRIREQMDALNQAESKLAATLSLADNATEQDVARLTEVYQRMKPADAAAIFQTMDIQFAAGFLSRMRPESSAAIMANLPAELAYSISVVMAGRNAAAPRQ